MSDDWATLEAVGHEEVEQALNKLETLGFEPVQVVYAGNTQDDKRAYFVVIGRHRRKGGSVPGFAIT